jgi:hypothetical protein
MSRVILILIVVATLTISPAPVPAGTLAPTKASQLVTLLAPGGGTPCGAGQGQLVDQQIDPSGGNHTLQIPAGQVLIVTGGTILVDFGGAGNSVDFLLEEFGGGGGGGNPVHVSSVVLGSNGTGHADFVLDPGVVVRAISSPPSPLQGLCADAYGANPGAAVTATLHGFMAKDK